MKQLVNQHDSKVTVLSEKMELLLAEREKNADGAYFSRFEKIRFSALEILRLGFLVDSLVIMLNKNLVIWVKI